MITRKLKYGDTERACTKLVCTFNWKMLPTFGGCVVEITGIRVVEITGVRVVEITGVRVVEVNGVRVVEITWSEKKNENHTVFAKLIYVIQYFSRVTQQKWTPKGTAWEQLTSCTRFYANALHASNYIQTPLRSNQVIPGNDQNMSPTNQETAGSNLERTS